MANGRFQQGLQGLLSGSNPLSNLGIGLLAASGPRPQGTANFGSRLGEAAQFAQQRQQMAMQNEMMRQAMLQRQRQQQAQQQIQGILSAPERVPQGQPLPPGQGVMATRDQRQPELMGLLAQAAPEQFNATMIQGLLGQQQERAEPAPVRIARILADPNESQEVKDAIQQQINSSDDSEQIANTLRLLQVHELQRQLDMEQDQKARERTAGRISVLNADEALREAATINQRLRGTIGETGLGFNELRERMAGPWAAFVGLFGGDAQQARQVAADMQRFEQLTTREGLQSLFSGQVGAGTITNSKMDTYLTTKPSLNRLPETNSQIIADMLQDNLDSAEVLGISMPGRAQTEQLIETLRSTGQKESPRPSPERAPTSRRVIDFSELPQ